VAHHIVAVTGLIRNSAGRVLLVLNKRGWEMPGGQVDAGEDPIHALRREVREEAGCEIAVGRLFGVYSNVTEDLVILAFDCSYVSGTVRGGFERLDAAWHESAVAPAVAAHRPGADRIRDGLAGERHVIFRSYRQDSPGEWAVVAESALPRN
jgi:8-oxo-dGTP diphosphatase